ncbi:MAG: lytic transglycosylase [Paracoccaceae bacterium]
MGRTIRMIAVLFLVASCGGGRDMTPPRNLDDACSIIDQRPDYLRAMRDSERRWHVPVPVQMAIIYAESRFDGDARTPHRWAAGVIPMGRQSSAYGYSQALDGTWEEYQDDTRNRRAERDNIEDATDFIGWYARNAWDRNGIMPHDARNLYLAYHEGHAGFASGRHNSQRWLLDLAASVQQRAEMYDQQLRACGLR